VIFNKLSINTKTIWVLAIICILVVANLSYIQPYIDRY